VAVTAYDPGASDVLVAHEVAGSVTLQSVVPPEVNATVPVAPAGRPVTESVSDVPCCTDGALAAAVNEVDAFVTVKLAVADELVRLPSPEYVAVTGYEPGANEVPVAHEVAGSVTLQSVVPPEVKVTVPVALPWSPATDSVSAVP
jgi:hypothetical protein